MLGSYHLLISVSMATISYAAQL